MNWTNHFGGADRLSRIADGRRHAHQDFVQRQSRVGVSGQPKIPQSSQSRNKEQQLVSLDIRSLARINRLGTTLKSSSDNLVTQSQIVESPSLSKSAFSRQPPVVLKFPDSAPQMNFNDANDDGDLTPVEQFSTSSYFSSQPSRFPMKKSALKTRNNTMKATLSPVAEDSGMVGFSPPLEERQELPRTFLTSLMENSAAPSNSFPLTHNVVSSDGLSESSSDGYITETVSHLPSRHENPKRLHNAFGFADVFDELLKRKIHQSDYSVANAQQTISTWNRSLYQRRPPAKSIAADSVLDEVVALRPITTDVSDIESEEVESRPNNSPVRPKNSTLVPSAHSFLINNYHDENNSRFTLKDTPFLPSAPVATSSVMRFVGAERNATEPIEHNSQPQISSARPHSGFDDFFEQMSSIRTLRSERHVQTPTQVVQNAQSEMSPRRNEISSSVIVAQSPPAPPKKQFADCAIQTEENDEQSLLIPPHPAVVCILDEILSVICASAIE